MSLKRKVQRQNKRRRAKMPKFIKVPEDIKLKELVTRKETGDTYSFWKFIQQDLLTDYRFGLNWKNGRSAGQLSDAFFNAKAGEWVELETADYDLLKECADAPKYYDALSRKYIEGYQPLLLQQVLPFIRAIQEALDKLPKEKKVKEE